MPAAHAAIPQTQIITDPFTNTTSQHKTVVEPDTFAYGNTIVAAAQDGRFNDGGGSDIGYSTSTDGGATWTQGTLPGITNNNGGTGSFQRVSDASVAYDARHNVWLISSIPIPSSVTVPVVFVSRSTDGGLTFGNPVTVASGSTSFDKNWTVCDNTATSPFYGNCYTQWDDHGRGNLLQMSRSTDGGLTWSAPSTNNSGVIGGQPLVHPNGTVIVPTANANETAIGAFNSTNGGASWSAVTTIATIRHHNVAGSLREGPLPSAEIDGSGTVYVAWADCRFRRACRANDIVLSHSLNSAGTSWSGVSRVPIDGTNSGIDHFIPGLAVNKATSGSTADLGLTYYFFPSGSAQLSVGFISSTNAGASWSAAQTIINGMSTTWAANTSQGRMVGDYISTSFGSDGLAHGVFSTATAPSSGTTCGAVADNCNEPTNTFVTGLAASTVAMLDDPVLFSGNGGANANSLWKVVDNNGSKHRD